MPENAVIPRMRSAGFSDKEIRAAILPDVEKMRSAGFSDAAIGEVYGIRGVTPFDDEPIRASFRETLREADPEGNGTIQFMQAVNQFLQPFEAGVQQSIVGLAARQQVPDVIVPEDAPAFDRIASQVTAVALDLPFFALGAGIGSASGGGFGSVVTGTAGAFALPAALREVLLQTYENGQIETFGQFWDVLSGAITEEFKGYLTGAAVGAAGTATGGAVVAKLGARGITRPAAATASRVAEISAMVSVGSALEGEVPDRTDFLDAGAVILTLVGARSGARSLRRIYRNSGRTPAQVLEESVSNPTIREDLASKNHSEEPRAFKEVKPAEKEEITSEVDSRVGEPVAAVLRDKKVEREAKKPETGLEEVKEQISFKEPKERRTIRETLDSLYADWFREQYPLAKAVKEMANGAEIPIVENAAALAQLEPGVIARATHFLEYAPLEFETFNRVGRPFKSILEPVKSNLEDLSAYLVAKRTVELAQRDLNTGIDVEVARRAVREGRERFEEIATELVEFQGHVLAYLRDAGVVGAESFELMRAAGRDYVPLNRVFDEKSGIARKGGGKKARDPIFRFRGSERQIVNPLESIIKNTYLFISIAERNQIGLQLVRLAADSGREDVARQIKQKSRPVTVKAEEVKRAIKKWEKGEELTREQSRALEEFAEAEMTIFRPNGLRPGDNQILVFEGGKKSLWEIDPEIYRTFAAGSEPTNSIIWKILAAPARLVRAGAILSPEFAARNPIRDQFTAFIFSENKLRIFVDFARGIGSVSRRDADFQDWLISGGPQAAVVSLDRQYLQRGIREIMETRGLTSVIRNVAKNPIEMMRILSEASEAGTRVGEFKRGIRDKIRTKESLLRAGLDSRNVSLDFGQMGTQARAMNQIIPFFAANLNGADRMVRAFKDNPKRAAARTAASITIPSVMLYLHNREQSWYKDLPQWVKDLTWPIKIGDTIWKIPKPFEIGIIFGTGAERITEALIERDSKAFDGFRESLLRGSTPGFVPTLPSPIIETYANRKIFFDTPIVPGRLERVLPEYQYKAYTTELTKALGRTIATFPGMKNSVAASPLVLENFVTAWTGGLGRHILNLADLALRKAGALPDPVKPATDLLDVLPGIKGFTVRHPSLGTQPIQDFFERYAKNEMVINTINRLTREGDVEAAQRERNIAGPGNISLRGMRDSIAEVLQLIRMVENPRMPGTQDEKRQIIDNYYIMVNNLATLGLEQIERLEAGQ